MNINLTISLNHFTSVRRWFGRVSTKTWVVLLACFFAVLASLYSYYHDYVLIYGDAESHLNIAKRVVDSLTPGFAQLGGIWLPLPHIFLMPLIYFNFFWQTGLGGSIVSGICFVIASVYIYKTVLLLTKSQASSVVSALVFISNPNILYMQSTPMTELTLIVFFVLSSYFFIKYLLEPNDLKALLLSACFGFLASLSRYDGWFLVAIEASIIFLMNSVPIITGFHKQMLRKNFGDTSNILASRFMMSRKKFKDKWNVLEGKTLFFATPAFFGIFIWLGWDWLILGDPLYFTHSQFSAKSQQLGWLAKGELPAYHNLWTSFVYYLVASIYNIGVVVFILALVGMAVYLFKAKDRYKFYIVGLLLTPFVFYVVTLFLGQSIMFLPGLTPDTFEWTLFNARYGVMMVPVAAIFVGYLFSMGKLNIKLVAVILCLCQLGLFGIGFSKVVTLQDGLVGLSTAKRPDAERWMAEHYDHGLVLLDDYSRLMSIIRAKIPMENVIYIGNKPYWEESLESPEKYATWIVVQRNDAIWNAIYSPPVMQGRLYKYFQKAYTSPEIIIFKRNPEVPAG